MPNRRIPSSRRNQLNIDISPNIARGKYPETFAGKISDLQDNSAKKQIQTKDDEEPPPDRVQCLCRVIARVAVGWICRLKPHGVLDRSCGDGRADRRGYAERPFSCRC